MHRRAFAWMVVALVLLTVVMTTQAQDPRSNIAASAVGEGPMIVSSVCEPDGGCEGGLINDDGTFENGYSFNPGFGINNQAYFAEPYTLPAVPYQFQHACICLTRVGSDADFSFDVIVFDDAESEPATELERVTITATAVPIWPTTAFYTFPLSVVATAPDIWVGVNWNPDVEQGFFFCADENGPSPSLGRVTIDGGTTWENPTAYWPSYKAMGIRADGCDATCTDLQATASCQGEDLLVEILAGDPTFGIEDSTGILADDVGLGTYVLAGPGTWENLTVFEYGGNCESIDLGDWTCPSVAAVDYPNKGEILISVAAPVTPYGAAGNYPLSLTLPADYDGNGFDTYIITGSTTVADETWYSIWVGGVDYVWVPASQVIVLR